MSVKTTEDSFGEAFKHITFPVFITTIFILALIMKYFSAVSNDWISPINFELKQVKSFRADNP